MKRLSRLNVGIWTQGALLVGLVAVLAVRAVGLVQHPLLPSAEREERYLAWAWREPQVGRVLAQVESALAPGEPVMLALTAQEAGDSKWWSFMASYYLTRNPVVGVKARPAALASAPPEAAVVLITPRPSRQIPERQIQILRHGRRAESP